MADVDITDLVDALKSAFIDWAVGFVFGLTIAQPLFSWLALPVINSIYRLILKGIIGWLANSAEMAGFFLNTALKKSGQAKDFVDAVNLLKNLPKNVSDAEYAKAEQNQIDAFNALVRIT
jgi:hypothetical protein